MYLGIDTSEPKIISLYYSDKTRLERRDFSLLGEGSLLASIDSLLNDLGQPMTALKGITVVVGHGRWTAIRMAVVVTNSLAYTLAIPVMTVGSPDQLEASFVMLQTKPAGEYVLPVYNGEVRIGKK